MTPHYWTAAEMLLLQLDMLAYVNSTAKAPTLVIGAGIPREWLKQPFNVKGLIVDGNFISWAWDGKQINVQIRGEKMNVQPGSIFPRNTRINIAMLQDSESPDKT